MSYKNSMKLFASNFTLVWKQLLYLVICGFIFTLASYTLITPIINTLKAAGVGHDLKNLFSIVYNSPNQFALEVGKFLRLAIDTVISNFSSLFLNLLGALVLCVILPYVLCQMSMFNLSSILYQKFTMNMEVGYTQNALATSKQGLKYAFACLVLDIPYLVLMAAFLEFYLMIATSVLVSIIGLILLSAIYILISSLKLTLFSYFTGHMVATNANPFKSFGNSIIKVLKNFWKIMGQSIVLQFTIIFINGFLAVFTFFAGLIVTIPATFVLVAVYKAVTYLNTKGERYYLSNTVIFNPSKHIVTHDEFSGEFLPPEEIKEIQVTTSKLKKNFKETKPKKSKTKKGKYGKQLNKQ